MCSKIKNKPLRYVLYGVGGAVLAVVFAIVFGFFVMLLWNWLMPDLFNIQYQITFWQAAGLILLARLIFGHIGHGHRHPRHHESHFPFSREKSRFKNKFYHDKSPWKFYHKFWEEEGKKAFHDYVERKNSDKTQTNEEKGE